MALSKKDLEELVKTMQADYAAINNKLTKLDSLVNDVAELKKLLAVADAKNAELLTTLRERDAEIHSLKRQLNSVEQHNRSWSIRVMGLPLAAEEEKSSSRVKQQLYNTLLKPILEGAVAEGELAAVPGVDDLLEMAHVLPAKEGATKPIIARFHARELRSLVFRHKKQYAPKHATGPMKERYKYLLFEDLTKLTFSKMRALAQDPGVAACWSANGQLRYRLVDDPTVRRVKDVLDPVARILA
jgi:hypothetical protein